MAAEDGRDQEATRPEQRVSRRGFVTGALGVGLAAATPAALAGCSGGASGTGSNGESIEDPAAVKGGPKTTPRDDVIYPDGYVGPIASDKGPIVVKREKVTLTIAVPQDTEVADWNKNEFSKWYEERTGVHVEYQTVAGEEDSPEQQTKLNAMISSGDLPDAFMSFGFKPSQLMLYGQQGLVIRLNELIDQYGVEIKRVYKDYPQVKEYTTDPEGNIWVMPYVNDCFHCKTGGQRMWVYKPWLDKLGLDVPETLDDFEAMLEAFVTQDPNGNGERDELPLEGAEGDGFDTYFMGSFMYTPQDPWLYLDNGKVDIAVNKDGWREGLRYINRLYSKGLIAKEAFTQDGDQLIRLGDKKGDRALGAARAYYWGSFLTIDDDSPDAEWRDYVAVPTLRAPGYEPTSYWSYQTGLTAAFEGWAGGFLITNACENPGVALMWADGLYELTAQLSAYSGMEGKEWRFAKEGETGINGNQALWTTLGTWPPDDGKWWSQRGVNYRSNDFRLGEVVDPKAPTFELPLYEESKKYYERRQPQEMELPPLYMTEEQAAMTGEVAVSIENHVTTHLAKFSLGELDPNDNAEWEKYTSTLADMGLDRYLETYQAAYDEKYK